MKTKILTLLAASCICLLSACSEESESLADKCKDNNGVNEGCIVGKWSLKAMYNKTDNTIVTDYNAAPGLLEINGDGSFTYTTSAAPSSEMASTGCSGQKVYGSWEINDASVKFTVKTGDCATSGTVTPVVDELQMNFNGVRFQAGDATDAMTKANSTEIYDRVE